MDCGEWFNPIESVVLTGLESETLFLIVSNLLRSFCYYDWGNKKSRRTYSYNTK